MPLPKPNDGEGKKKFLDRCMGNAIMTDEYPDEKQRYAVCNSLWEKKGLGMEKEVRYFDVELRMSEDESPKIIGHAAVFNQWSEDLGGFREKIRPGAFKKTLKESDVRALFNHDSNYVLGRNKSGTLGLSEDDTGLAIEIDPPDTTWANDLKVSMKRGDVNQMSFGFQTVKDEWNNEDKDKIERELVEVKLFDVSVVTYPAYPQTNAQVRAMVQQLTDEPVPEDHSEEVEDEPDKSFHSLRKRRLELAELEIEIQGE